MAKIKKAMKGGSKVAADAGKKGKKGPMTEQVRSPHAAYVQCCCIAYV